MADALTVGIVVVALVGLIVLFPPIQPLLLIGAILVADLALLSGILPRFRGIPSLIIFTIILAVCLIWILDVIPIPIYFF